MGNDDKLDDDPLAGKTDPVNYAARLQRVADIVTRAQSRFNKVLAEPGPIQDPGVQAALQAIVTNANTLRAAAANLITPGSPAGP